MSVCRARQRPFLCLEPHYSASRPRQTPILFPAASSQGQKRPNLPRVTLFSCCQGQNWPILPLAEDNHPKFRLPTYPDVPNSGTSVTEPATRFDTRCRKWPKLAPTRVLKPGSAPNSAKNGAEIRRSAGSTLPILSVRRRIIRFPAAPVMGGGERPGPSQPRAGRYWKCGRSPIFGDTRSIISVSYKLVKDRKLAFCTPPKIGVV